MAATRDTNSRNVRQQTTAADSRAATRLSGNDRRGRPTARDNIHAEEPRRALIVAPSPTGVLSAHPPRLSDHFVGGPLCGAGGDEQAEDPHRDHSVGQRRSGRAQWINAPPLKSADLSFCRQHLIDSGRASRSTRRCCRPSRSRHTGLLQEYRDP